MCPRLTIPTLLVSAGTEEYVLLLLQNEAQNAYAQRNYKCRLSLVGSEHIALQEHYGLVRPGELHWKLNRF